MFKIIRKSEYDRLNKYFKIAANFEKENKKLRDANDSKDKEIDKLKKANEQQRFDWLRKKSEYDKQLEERIISLQKELDKQKQKTDELNSDNKTLRMSRGGLKASIVKKDKKIDRLQKEIRELHIKRLPATHAKKQKMHSKLKPTNCSTHHVLKEKSDLRCQH